MNIVAPYAVLIDVPDLAAGIARLQTIEWCARISHRTEEMQTEDSWQRFITAVVLGHGDWSVVEHATARVDFVVDRGITHEEVRHRLQAITQESQRFVNYEKKMPASFIYPCDNTPESWTEPIDSDWADAIALCESSYQKLIAKGWAPQRACSVLPRATSSRLISTMNLRAWRHFLLSRTTKEAHPQMRQVTIPLLRTFQERIPLLYDDIEPLGKQADNFRKIR